jgi:hypothetical protein
MSEATQRKRMNTLNKTKAMMTDKHFVIPMIVLCLGVAVLIALH